MASVDAKGNRSTTVFDSVGRTAARINPLGNRWTAVYNTVGQTVGSKDPLGNRNTTVYDSASRGVASINPLGKRTTTVYNIDSQSLATIDANGNRVSSVYDALGRRSVEINASGGRTTTVYNAVGQTSALVDARGNRHSFVYDSTGAQTQLIDPLGRRTTSAYDVAGQQNLRIDARNYRTTYAYSTVGQLTSRRYPNGTRATFVFDTVGNRTGMRDSTGRCTATYDALNRVTQYRTPFTKVLTYVYDAVGLRARLWENSGGRHTYTYDAASQLTRIVNGGSVTTTFVYNAAGQRTVLRPGNGTRTSYSYDAAGQTTQIFHRKSTGVSLLQLDYRYDNAGNRTELIEDAGAARVTWAYDPQNQLIGENRTGTNAYRQTYTYDPAGNRTVKNVGGTRTTSSYDTANQLTYALAAAGRTTYAFDPAGNQQLELTPAGARTTTTWNYENQPSVYQLTTGSRVTMSYNADNRRTQKQTAATVSTKFVWEPTTDAYYSQLDNSNTNQKLFTFEPKQYGNLISQRITGEQYVHADALGSTRALSTGGTTVSDTFLYDAWGNEVARTGTTANVPFRWVGGVGYYYDTETGLYYVRARVYQPMIARWASIDPLGLADGTNAYGYALNWTIQGIDASGTFCTVCKWQVYSGLTTFAKIDAAFANGLRIVQNEANAVFPLLWDPFPPSVYLPEPQPATAPDLYIHKHIRRDIRLMRHPLIITADVCFDNVQDCVVEAWEDRRTDFWSQPSSGWIEGFWQGEKKKVEKFPDHGSVAPEEFGLVRYGELAFGSITVPDCRWRIVIYDEPTLPASYEAGGLQIARKSVKQRIRIAGTYELTQEFMMAFSPPSRMEQMWKFTPGTSNSDASPDCC